MLKPKTQTDVVHDEPPAAAREARRAAPELSLGSDRIDIDNHFVQVTLKGEFSDHPGVALTVAQAYTGPSKGATETTTTLNAESAHALAAAIEKRACQLDGIAINRAEVGKRQRESAGFNPDEPEAVGLF